MPRIEIEFYSDLLCIWAFAAERRVAELCDTYGDSIDIIPRFCSVFPDARAKIEQNWKDKGGYAGFNRHSLEVAERFPHIRVHDRLWLDVCPRSSASAHLFVKAVEVIEADRQAALRPYLDRLSTRAASALRHAFFTEGRDIADWQVQEEIAAAIDVPYDQVMAVIRSARAIAALAADLAQSQAKGITGSPTFLMNEGRQRLFGNVGYRVLEANVNELLRNDAAGVASWC